MKNWVKKENILNGLLIWGYKIRIIDVRRLQHKEDRIYQNLPKIWWEANYKFTTMAYSRALGSGSKCSWDDNSRWKVVSGEDQSYGVYIRGWQVWTSNEIMGIPGSFIEWTQPHGQPWKQTGLQEILVALQLNFIHQDGKHPYLRPSLQTPHFLLELNLAPSLTLKLWTNSTFSGPDPLAQVLHNSGIPKAITKYWETWVYE